MELNNFMFEKWMLIDGYINYYVSNFGRVINMTTHKILKQSIRNGYKCVTLCSNIHKSFNVHRLVASSFIPNDDEKHCVDHKNNNRLDNNVVNLRWCTNMQNSQNMSKRENASSIYKGVTYYKPNKKWQAVIMHNKTSIYLGRFLTQEEAGRAYNEKASELFGEFAKLNVF